MSAWQLKAASPPPRSRARRKTCYERRAWRRQIRPRSSPSVPAAGSRPRITQPAAVPTSAHATVDMASSRYHQTRGPARPKGSAPSHLCSGALWGAREEEIAARSQHRRLFSVFCARAPNSAFDILKTVRRDTLCLHLCCVQDRRHCLKERSHSATFVWQLRLYFYSLVI